MKENINHSIAVLEGDGIGPEITCEALKVLSEIASKYNRHFEYRFAPFGAKAYFDHGHPFPDSSKEICDSADVIIKGPIGLAVEKMNTIPLEFRPEKSALIPLRMRYDLYANYRPIFMPKSCTSIAKVPSKIPNGIDILMMRELSGGPYNNIKVEGKETNMKYARDIWEYSYDQVQRFAHICFKEARNRENCLISIHKSNVLATSRFWEEIFHNVSKEYFSVKFSSMLVDNAAFQISNNPSQFNHSVIALENLMGDILTDEAADIIGSLGLMPSACINPETKKACYEPAHGSAPDIANQNIANPFSMIGSIALMLEKSFGYVDESKDVWASLFRIFEEGYRTKDLAKDTNKEKILSTSQFGDKVISYLRE